MTVETGPAAFPAKPETVEGLKRQAQRLKKETGCKHTKALEMVSRVHGWRTYAAAKTDLEGTVRPRRGDLAHG